MAVLVAEDGRRCMLEHFKNIDDDRPYLSCTQKPTGDRSADHPRP